MAAVKSQLWSQAAWVQILAAHCSLAVCSRANCLTSRGFGFLTCKMEIQNIGLSEKALALGI